MDMSEMRVPLQGAAKIFEAGLKSKTWDIHRMPQFIMMTHREGCKTCDVYALHEVKASEASTVEIPSREVKKAFWIAWPNIVHHIEDEASSVLDKKVEWYSTTNWPTTSEWQRTRPPQSEIIAKRQMKSYCKLTQKLRSLKPSLQSSNKSSLSCKCRTKECRLFGMINMGSWVLIQNPLLADWAGKGRRARHSHLPSAMGASSWVKPVHQYWLTNWCRWCWHHHHRQWGLRPHCPWWCWGKKAKLLLY